MKILQCHSLLFRVPILLILLASAVFANFGYSDAFTDRVDLAFRNWDKPTSPGCTIAILKDGAYVYKKSYGMANLQFDIPNSPQTVYRVASTSKQFTVMAALLLEEEGLLSLDDEVRIHIPELPDFGHRITIDHLIYHTSGLRDYLSLMVFGGWNFFADFIDKQQALMLVERQKKLNFDPGTQYIYSNTGYMLLAEIVARISGKTFAEFTRERIFEPLGMTHSEFRDNDAKVVKQFANQYALGEDGNYYQIASSFYSVGEAGVTTTIEDLAKWDENFINPKVGSQATIDKMHQVGRLNNGTPTGYARGIIVDQYNGRRIVFHGGDLGGFHSQTLRFPDQHFSILVMSNTAELFSNTLLMHALQISDFYFANPVTDVQDFKIHEPSKFEMGLNEELLQSLDQPFEKFLDQAYRRKSGDLSIKPAGDIAPSAISASAAQEYTGRYYSDEVDCFFTLIHDEETQSLLFQLPRYRPYFYSANNVRRDIVFFDNNPGAELKCRFFRNEAGEVAGFYISNSRAIDLEFRKAEIVTKN